MEKVKAKKATPAPTLAAVLRNNQAIERKMDDLRMLFERNAAMLAALTNNAPVPRNGQENLNQTDRAVLIALSSLLNVGVHIVPRNWLAVIARLSPKSGPYRTSLAKLTVAGSIVKAGKGSVALSLADTPWQPMHQADAEPLDLDEILRRTAEVFRRQEADILLYLCIHLSATKDEWMDRKQLAERAKQSPDSSAFRERLAQLREQGFIEFGPNQTVRSTLQWFTPQKASA